MKKTTEISNSTDRLGDERVLEGVSEENLLKQYMESMDCKWRYHELRDIVRKSNGFQLHLACIRFNEALTSLWNSIPWYRKILIRVSSWLNAL